jgi:AP-1 complex subunit beta-1
MKYITLGGWLLVSITAPTWVKQQLLSSSCVLCGVSLGLLQDSQDPNPLIRALAVRTMGCIRVDKITEYLCDPLQRCLKDDDPYVRKTAAVCVAKLHDINAELVEDRGFLEALKDMISDSNPMVVANAVASLAEIQEGSSKLVFEITNHTLFKLLAALNECTE